MQACNEFNTITVKICLEYTYVKINVNAKFSDGVNALMIAIKTGICPTAQCLIESITDNKGLIVLIYNSIYNS